MCGIAGLVLAGDGQPTAAQLDAMAGSIAHRGPDGGGRHLAGNLALVQTRLAIIDLQTGDQPLFLKTDDGNRLALVANGEVYNYRELRAEMAGATFATGSDCEPPLHLYARVGLDFADRLRGMYAIAIHDPTQGRLVLTRDPFGIKPLYYAKTAAGLVFGSEIRALFASGMIAPVVRPQGRNELLQMQFTTGAETIFEGVYRVLPGETLVVDVASAKIVARRRRPAIADGAPRKADPETALTTLDAVLEGSVDVHQRSDVPYGMFLSGGIDSSALLTLMARLNDRPVTVFTAYFPDTQARDERARAKAVAGALGADVVEVPFGEDDFWSLLPAVAAAMDDPAADYATLPTYKLASVARQHGIKVILSGEGGDELFAGYGRYRDFARLLMAKPMRRKGAFDGIAGLRVKLSGWRSGIKAATAAAQGKGRTRLQQAQAVDIADWLPNDLLTKADRCLMAHGVEGRVPFLDPQVAAFAFALPDRLKLKDRRGKWLLRAWLDRHLPVAGAFEKKRGFTVPVGEWIAGRADELAPRLSALPWVSDLIEADALAALLRGRDGKASAAAWNILFYALWYRANVAGLAPKGDVFSTT